MLIDEVYRLNEHKLSMKTYTDTSGTSDVSGKSIFSVNTSIKRRYFLEKRWSEGDRILVAIMMNPSKADEKTGDDTVNQLINQARSRDYNALYILNLSTKVEGTSCKLKMSDFDYDKLNWSFIKAACETTNDTIFIGWGMKGQKGLKRQLKQDKKRNELYQLLSQFKNRYACYELKGSLSKNKYDPKYYVPHPRPWFNKEKYLNQPFNQLVDFNKVFIRP